MRERLLRKRHVHRGRLDVPRHRRRVHQRELRHVRWHRAGVLPGRRRQSSRAVHRGRRRVRRQQPVRRLRRSRSAVLLPGCVHRHQPRVSERHLRAVRWIRAGVLCGQRVHERRVHGGPRVRPVRRRGRALLRRRLLRVWPRVRERRLRPVRWRRPAVLRGRHLHRLDPGLQRPGRLRDLRRTGTAVLRGGHVHLGPHVHGQPGVRYVRRTGRGVLRGSEVHRRVARLRGRHGTLHLRSMRRIRPGLLRGTHLRDGAHVPRQQLSVT